VPEGGQLKLYVVRHGETEWNREQRLQGRTDVPLNETGRRQAHCLARYFQAHPISKILTSPLRRALATAEIIAGTTGGSFQIHEELVEIHHGVWQGLTVREIEVHHPEMWKIWNTRPSSLELPEGESLRDVADRIRSLFRTVDASLDTCIVTHGVVSQVLLLGLMERDLDELHMVHQSNGCINIFEMAAADPEAEVLDFTQHLAFMECGDLSNLSPL
jgi:broad specificity phosphatase PhoE